MNKIKLKKIDNSDLRFLYNLLKQRDPISNISHKIVPTFKEHTKFVLSKPYFQWYVIFFQQKKVGSIYLSKQDEIGIFLKNELQGKGIGNIALQLLIKENPRKRYLANITPKNSKSKQFFKKHGFKTIQYTYELTTE